MVKHFNIIMAGVISGIVALFTSWLGVSGTVIGSVLSSFLYQLLSTYYDEKTKDVDFSKVGRRHKDKSRTIHKNSDLTRKIVFIFPIVVILLIECLFCLTYMHYGFLKIFNLLEAATDQNLFRVMGISLILVGCYPFLKPKIVKRKNGFYLLLVGILLLLRGLIDVHPLVTKIFYLGFHKLDIVFAMLVIIVSLIVIINVLKTIKDKNVVEEYNPQKVDTHFNDNFDNHEIINENINPNFQVNNSNDNYFDDFGEEPLPIYEEDYIYVADPNNPNKTIRKKILKKISDGYNRPKRK